MSSMIKRLVSAFSFRSSKDVGYSTQADFDRFPPLQDLNVSGHRLQLPRDPDSVVRARHKNTPQQLPDPGADCDEVRYFLYAVLTSKVFGCAKTYPQWVLETCWSWEGNGEELLRMNEAQLMLLCPYNAGSAGIDTMRYNVDVLVPPGARDMIGKAIISIMHGGAKGITSLKNQIQQDLEFERARTRSLRRSATGFPLLSPSVEEVPRPRSSIRTPKLKSSCGNHRSGSHARKYAASCMSQSTGTRQHLGPESTPFWASGVDKHNMLGQDTTSTLPLSSNKPRSRMRRHRNSGSSRISAASSLAPGNRWSVSGISSMGEGYTPVLNELSHGDASQKVFGIHSVDVLTDDRRSSVGVPALGGSRYKPLVRNIASHPVDCASLQHATVPVGPTPVRYRRRNSDLRSSLSIPSSYRKFGAPEANFDHPNSRFANPERSTRISHIEIASQSRQCHDDDSSWKELIPQCQGNTFEASSYAPYPQLMPYATSHGPLPASRRAVSSHRFQSAEQESNRCGHVNAPLLDSSVTFEPRLNSQPVPATIEGGHSCKISQPIVQYEQTSRRNSAISRTHSVYINRESWNRD